MAIHYEPLSAGQNEIRLLEIQASSEVDDIPSCRLRHHTLEEDQLLRYCALSYVWGNELDRNTILVDGHEVSVTRNLFQAFRCISSQIPLDANKPLYLWADALCINQKDLKEKAEQISLMGLIFSSADTVVAHVGLGSLEVQHAMDTLEDLQPRLATYLTKKDTCLDWIEEYPGLWRSDKEEGELSTFWDGLIELMTATYWTRAWILQEMALATRLLVLAGGGEDATCSLDFQTLFLWHAFVVDLRIQRGNPLPSRIPSLLWSAASHMYAAAAESIQIVLGFVLDFSEPLEHGMPRKKTRMTDLKELYRISKKFGATEPRDLIYAYLGLLELDIKVDYSEHMPVSKLYTDFATKCIEANECARVLCLSGVGWNNMNLHGLPSWVPDWHYLSTAARVASLGGDYAPHPHNLLNGEREYRANQGLEWASPRPNVTDSSFIFPGCVLETINSNDGFSFNHTSTISNSTKFESLFELCGRFCAQKTSAVPALQVIFRTVLQDVYHIEGDESRLYSDNPMRLLKAALAFLACVVDPYCDKVHHILKRLRSLGYDDSAESYREFLFRTFFAGVDDPMAPAILDAMINGMVVIPNQLGSDPLNVLRMGGDALFRIQESAKYFPTVTADTRNTATLLVIDNLSNNKMVPVWNGQRLALVPPWTLTGDLLCILAHCQYPVIMRKSGDCFSLVGPCYVFGFMDGEAAEMVDQGKLNMQDFSII